MVDIPRSVIDTLIAEAAGEGEEGMRRVAETILNRAAIRNLTPDQVVRQANQYTGWSSPGPAAVQAQNNAAVRALAEQAYRTALEPGDPTGGADHYFNPSIVQPRWANSMTPTGEYGGHAFYSSRPIPPGEIPNAVASALSVTPTPRVAPVPRTMSDDLGQMRNPLMSASAQMSQVTPLPPPLPQRRPSAPDIVTPSMAAVNAQRGNVNATRAVDMIAATQNPVTPRLTADGSNIMSYHIPDMTPTTVTGGLGSLTPSPARVRLPELPPSNLGQSPKTRVVQSIPFTSSSMPSPTTAQINNAARRAALTANQSNVERNPAPRPVGSSTQNIAAQRAEQLSQRPPTSARLAPGPVGLTPNTQGVTLNQPPIQVVAPPARTAPIPMAAGMRPSAPLMASIAPPVQRLPLAASAPQSPMRVVVDGAGSYSAPQRLTPTQALMAQGLTNAQAYNALTAQRPTLEDRVRGSSGLSSSGASAYSISG